jgi:hypothetical protein
MMIIIITFVLVLFFELMNIALIQALSFPVSSVRDLVDNRVTLLRSSSFTLSTSSHTADKSYAHNIVSVSDDISGSMLPVMIKKINH